MASTAENKTRRLVDLLDHKYFTCSAQGLLFCKEARSMYYGENGYIIRIY